MKFMNTIYEAPLTMIEKILIIVLPLIYLGAFITRNLRVRANTRQRIRAADPLLTASIALTSLCILTAVLSTLTEPWYLLMGPVALLRSPLFSFLGLALFGIGVVMGWFFSGQLKNSWRVGVHPDQKTALIQSGIYARIRNPYFLSYFIMLGGLLLVRPSVVMMLLVIATIAIFHRMVLKEEAYLSRVHGQTYEAYRKATGRYLPRR